DSEKPKTSHRGHREHREKPAAVLQCCEPPPCLCAPQIRMDDLIQQFAETIRAAAEDRRPLRIRGGGSKDFYGNPASGEDFDVTGYRGIIDYEPTELVITARAGTPLAEIEAAMRGHGQMLGFEPPHFGGGATIGGCIAAGLSGPRRATAGSARDFVLGLRLLDGRGTDL